MESELSNPEFTDSEGYFRTDFPRGFNIATGYITHTKDEGRDNKYEVFKLSQTKSIPKR